MKPCSPKEHQTPQKQSFFSQISIPASNHALHEEADLGKKHPTDPRREDFLQLYYRLQRLFTHFDDVTNYAVV